MLVLVLAVGGAWAEPRPKTPTVPAGWRFSLPAGDAKAGRTVYERMECHSCHKLGGVPEQPPAGAGGIGPDLDGYGLLPDEYLAEAIIKAHRVVAAPGYVVESGQAGMGKYNHFLTVQELIDLVAFLAERRGSGE